MDDFDLGPGPGKTAPRLLDDLREYDARKPPGNAGNLLTEPAPIWREAQSNLYPLRQRSTDCTHDFWRKDYSTIIPVIDEIPTTASRFISSSYCDHCFHHFDVVSDYTRRPERIIPCHQDNVDFPLHHLRHLTSYRKSVAERKANPNKYDNHFVSHTFVCSAPDCPLVVDVRISPSRLNKERLWLLCDKAKVFQRAKKAIDENPERYKDYNNLSAEPWEALKTLRTYLMDALAVRTPGQVKRIAVQNKKFLMLFGNDCDDLLQYLDFTPYSEYNEDVGSNDHFWRLPVIDSLDVDAPFGSKSQIDFLSDVTIELAHRMSELAPQTVNIRQIVNPLPARKDQYKVLACDEYPRWKRPVDVDSDVHPHYLGLGANRDFSDKLILFAYVRQHETDPHNRPYYLECLLGIRLGRESDDLEMACALARSNDENTLSEIEEAYKFLNIPPDTPNGDAWIVGMYESRIEAAPRQKDEARKMLLIIGRARGSAKIQAVANDKAMTYAEALEFLEIQANVQSEWVETMATMKAADGNKAQVARAVQTIGKERNDAGLQLFAQSLESGDSTQILDVVEAYKRLQADRNLPDETIITYFQTHMSQAKNAPGSRAAYIEALRTIANSRGSSLLKAQADNPDGPMPVEKGSEDQPVGLDNIGNTCYLNSLLQYYYTVKPVRDVVMNFEDYRQELSKENILKKRVGGRKVDLGEAQKAQKLVVELQNLFTNLRQAPTKSVKPTEDLAVLTLFSATTEALFRRQSINSPGARPDLGSIMERPIFGPELPPPPTRLAPIPVGDDVEMVDRPLRDAPDQDDGSDTTLVDLESQTPDTASANKGIVMTDGSSEENELGEPTVDTNVYEPEYLIVSTDKKRNENSMPDNEAPFVQPVGQEDDQKITNGDTVASSIDVDSPALDNPPPVPPRNKPAPIKISSASTDSMKVDKLTFGAQQDVTEVIDNVMFRLMCAIKPTSLTEDGGQIDKIRETFYGANAYSLKKGATYDVKVEAWSNLIVFPAEEGSRDIYEALDVVFDEQVVEINNTQTTQYASISKLPPIFQIQFQRTAFDSKTLQASKNQNPIVFDETIYIDRYMDSERVMARRRDAWKWKTKLRKLEARQKALQKTKSEITVPEALTAMKDYLCMLQEEEIDGILVDGPLTESLSDRAVELNLELENIGHEVKSLKQKLQDQFTDMREHRYRLQAVFMHRGTNMFGHYWIYIYDFERDVWREYNDDRVSEVSDRKQIFEQGGKGAPTPYYLVYVRDEQKNELVDAVYRHIVEVPVEQLPESQEEQMEGNMVWDLDSEVAEGAQHVEYASLGGTMDQDVAAAGSWDAAISGSSRLRW